MPSDPRTDAELVAAANDGDADAFAALYERHKGYVVRVARRFTHDDALALDVMQEVFIDLLKRFPGFELRAELTTFLYPVTRHTAMAAERRRGRLTLTGKTIDAGARAPADPPERSRLLTALAALPPEQREVVLLHLVDDFSLQEIATATSQPLGTVKSRLRAGLAKLREGIGDLRFEI